MRARHVTSDASYRVPFGAAPLGGAVVLGIDVWDDDIKACELRLWVEGDGEHDLPMAPASGRPNHWEVSFTPKATGLLWYSFNITASDGAVWRYGARPGRSCGEGDFAYGEPPSFQITVYEPHERDTSWYTHGIVYQVFPDRFNRGSDWRERTALLADEHRNGPRRRLVEDWSTPPSYERNPDGSIACWDFYGGTLEGIRERLDYLVDLGVTVIYLNPICEAASNHRYDTADYLKVDPLLGTLEDFTRLCADAEAHGISIILDGVFNHTGRDSRYFNAFGNYPDVGAAQSDASPYRDWYEMDDAGDYASWWGVQDLPALDEGNPSYREFICGENGVVRTWLRRGARGWRLDVADELPDDFIADIKRAALAERPDAVVIGEVWEDATTKVAYDHRRLYFEGSELDGTMNYPFRTAALGFVCGTLSAGDFAAQMEQLAENYPPEAFRSELNLLGSHDRERLFTVLSGAPNPDTLNDWDRAHWRVPQNLLRFTKTRLWMAVLLQMCFPGVPCVYYGDECGMEGFRDPYNRAAFPADGGDHDCYTIFRNAIGLRKTLPVLTDGAFEPFAIGEHVFGFWRTAEDGSCVCLLANNSLDDAATVRIPMRGERVSDVVTGKAPRVLGDECEVFLWPLGTSLLHFHAAQRMQDAPKPGMGVICHVTSVPNEGRPGTLGEPSERFVDWLGRAGAGYWQILPVNPTDHYGSPYAGLSAFAGNPALVVAPPEEELGRLRASEGFSEFVEKNSAWLVPYATFRAVKDYLAQPAPAGGAGVATEDAAAGGAAAGDAAVAEAAATPGAAQGDAVRPDPVKTAQKDTSATGDPAAPVPMGADVPWWEWPDAYRDYDPALASRPELAERYAYHCLEQYVFEIQMTAIRARANERGVRIIGDMPMYVSNDSSDVWAHRELFALDEVGTPRLMAGAPPDNMSAAGQVWGNPCYRWDRHKATGYDWWMRRLARAFDLYDVVRLDHFLGFSSYYAIPAGKDALSGTWRFGPGLDFFRAAHERFGSLPLIAEDLGTVTPAVRALIAETGIPGMSVVQFAEEDVRQDYHPAPDSVAYASTHDTPTLRGWVERSFHVGDGEAAWLTEQIGNRVVASSADVAILQLQDVLGLGDEARMNVPGVATGNWSWHADVGQVEAASGRLAYLARRHRER